MAEPIIEVAILYEKQSKSSPGEFDLVKLVKFLKGLSQLVSCKIFTTSEFCDEKTPPKKWDKVVVFVRNEGKLKETFDAVKRKFDAEHATDMKIVVPTTARAKPIAPRSDVIRCKSFEEVADWYPEVLVFLFEHQERRDRLAVFMFDHEMDIEVKFYEKLKKILAKFNKKCAWSGALVNVSLDRSDQHVDTVVVVSRGEGDEVLPKVNNDATLMTLAEFPKINFVVFTDNKSGIAVSAVKENRDQFENSKPTIYKYKSTLELDYITWTSLFQKMAIIDCHDVTESNTGKVVLVLCLILVFPLIIACLVLALACWLVRPSIRIPVAPAPRHDRYDGGNYDDN